MPIKARNFSSQIMIHDGSKNMPIIAYIFIVSLTVPLIINISGIRLSAYRILLVIYILPLLFMFLSGKAGKFRVPDAAIIVISLWSSLSLYLVHGIDRIETAGILIIEAAGAYLMGRCLIRSADAFHKMVALLFLTLLAYTPFAIYETITGHNITLQIFGYTGPVPADVFKEKRWGFDRVQGSFEHPILFGVFFGSMAGLIYYVLGFNYSRPKKFLCAGLSIFTGALAFSSGPLSALVAQIIIIGWDRSLSFIKIRWYILLAGALSAYIVVDMLSNRNPFEVFISYAAFSAHTAYNRVLIWEYGTQSILNNPIIGIGLNEWERAWFMSTSADMFWIVPAMRHGIIVGVGYFVLFFWTFLSIANKKGMSDRLFKYRQGYLTVMAGFFLSGWTVHYWNATFILFIFILGSGMWMLDWEESSEKAEAPEKALRRNHVLQSSRIRSSALMGSEKRVRTNSARIDETRKRSRTKLRGAPPDGD